MGSDWRMGAALRFLRRLTQSKSQRDLKPRKLSIARRLSDKLWGGFSQYAVRELEVLKRCTSAIPSDRSEAAWYLARWYAFQQDYTRALDCTVFARVIDPSTTTNKDHRLIEVDCLLHLGHIENARDILNQELEKRGYDADLYLAYANTYLSPDGLSGGSENDAARLEWINRIYSERGLMSLVKAEPSVPLAINNLSTLCKPPQIEDSPKVSIIVPTYNAQNSLPLSLRALISQTWQNLEIIVVDDCSSDDTFTIAESYATQDPRVIAVRQTENLGTYVARNRGLEIATGQLITTHDAGDWSHPEKIETQIVNLHDNPGVVANFSVGARVTWNLRFATVASRVSRLIIHPNMVSALFARKVFDQCGQWDAVRIGADKEFLDRVRHNFGSQCIGRTLPTIPFSFSLDDMRSLTRSKRTHLVTRKHGIRREYDESAAHWRSSCRKQELRLDSHRCRSFPAPGLMLPKRRDRLTCDVLFAMDFNADCPAVISTMNYVSAAIEHGLTVALFHWRTYDADTRAPLNPAIRQTAQDGKLSIVAPGEKVSATTVVFGTPTILQHRIDLCPEVEFRHVVVIVDEMMGRYGGTYDPKVARHNLKTLFGTEGSWMPISEHVRQRMLADPRYPSPHPETWTPVTDAAIWCRRLANL
jgi:glycosyltransferase involved in cell wall biosynthesis